MVAAAEPIDLLVANAGIPGSGPLESFSVPQLAGPTLAYDVRVPDALIRGDDGYDLAAVLDEVGLAVLEAPDYYGDADAPTIINMTVHQAAGMVMGQLDCSIEEAMVRLRGAAFAESLSELYSKLISRSTLGE